MEDYRNAYRGGRAEVASYIRGKQLQAAAALNPAVLIWLGKQYLGQRDRRDGAAPRELEIQEGHRTITVRWDDEMERDFQALEQLEREHPLLPSQDDPPDGVTDVGLPDGK